MLKDICFSCFMSVAPHDRVALFFDHINELCKNLYKVALSYGNKKRNMSNDFSGKTEESNSSLDLDFTIKEALETIKTKDESFRSSQSVLGREVSPSPSAKNHPGLKSSDLQISSSTTSLHRRPYSNKSITDSPNTSLLGERPSSRYHKSSLSNKFPRSLSNSLSSSSKLKKFSRISHSTIKDSELDEFLKTEKLVESEVAKVKVSLQSSSAPRTSGNINRIGVQVKRNLNIKKLDFTRLKPEVNKKNSLQSSRVGPSVDSGRKTIVVRLDSNMKADVSSRSNVSATKKSMSVFSIGQVKKQVPEIPPKKAKLNSEEIVGKHRKFICKQRNKMLSRKFIIEMAFMCWRNAWFQHKLSKLR